MRLIDADELIESIDTMYKDTKGIVPDNLAEGCMLFEKLIKQQPTAYDVDSGCCRKCNSYAEGYQEGYKDGSNYVECGCEGCAFIDTEEWEMPCAKCKRGQKDYYRRPAKEKKDDR